MAPLVESHTGYECGHRREAVLELNYDVEEEGGRGGQWKNTNNIVGKV